MKLQPVRILRAFDKYNQGEIAGFEPELTKRLIADGTVELFDPESQPGNEVSNPNIPATFPTTGPHVLDPAARKPQPIAPANVPPAKKGPDGEVSPGPGPKKAG